MDTELNDILIKQDDAGGGRVKNMLLITAALLLIVVIGVLTYRVIENTPPEDTTLANTESGGQTVIETDPTAAATEEPDPAKSALDEIIARHREQRDQSAATQPSGTPATAGQSTQTALPPLATFDTPPKTTATPAATTPPKAATPATPATPPSATTPPKPATPAATTPAATTTPPKAATPAAPASQTSVSFYIQVESLVKSPRDEYLKSLRDRGYTVSVKDRVIDGKQLHRICVGPYATREAAVAVLPNIKRDYNPEAFVFGE